MFEDDPGREDREYWNNKYDFECYDEDCPCQEEIDFEDEDDDE